MNFIPSTKGIYYDAKYLKWAKIETVLQGEDGIKAAGKIYLPQLSGQTPTEYEAYKARGCFFNAFARTVDGLTGAIIRKEPQIKTVDAVNNLLANITLAGESIQEVIKMTVKNVLSFGYYGILVDTPAVADGDVTEANPYFALYPCSSILNFETVQVGAENKLVMLALAEVIYKKDLANTLRLVAVDQVRIFTIEAAEIGAEGSLVVRVFIKKEESKGTKEEVWEQVGTDIQPKIRGKRIDYIPFVFFGSVSNNPVPSDPPMLDLINLNIKHWQVSTDYYHGLHYCAMPTPWAAGFGKNAELYIGATKAWVSDDPQAQAGFLEFTGTGLGAIEKALSNLEKQMAIMGARMLEEQKKAAEAAETVEMRYSGDTATLSNIVSCVEQGIIKAIDLIGYWLGIEAKTEMKLNRDFVSQKLAPQEITALLQAYQAGGISLDTFLYKMQVGEVLAPETTIEDEKIKIAEEAATSFENAPQYDEEGNQIDADGNIIE